MKNVIVFDQGGDRFAAELRWVREVISLGFVTPVPNAPMFVAGVVNLRGTLLPVLHLAPLRDASATVAAAVRHGDGAILLDVEGLQAALHIDKVDAVSTLESASSSSVVDARGRQLPLIHPPTLLRRAVSLANQTRELLPLPADDVGGVL